jgi:hypothetical protein
MCAKHGSLVAIVITREFKRFDYDTSKGQTRQLNLSVEVASQEEGRMLETVLNPEEHQAIAWIGGLDEIKKFSMSESMGVVVANNLI